MAFLIGITDLAPVCFLLLTNADADFCIVLTVPDLGVGLNPGMSLIMLLTTI
jgi:hypothetical protein